MLGKPRAVGFVIYTYSVLEERFSQIWNWFSLFQNWLGFSFMEYVYTPRECKLGRVIKATTRSVDDLHQRMTSDDAWYMLNFGYPEGTCNSLAYKTKGVFLTLQSQPADYSRYRNPSYLYVILHPDHVAGEASKIQSLLDLIVVAWETIDGVYGFIDIETGIPPRDNLIMNFDHQVSNFIPDKYRPEFISWQRSRSRLDKCVWKGFWGNMLGSTHLSLIGRDRLKQDSSANKSSYSNELELEQGLYTIQNQLPSHHLMSLANDGLLIAASKTPIDWNTSVTQKRISQIDTILKPLAIPM